jgi:hypothetical protein
MSAQDDSSVRPAAPVDIFQRLLEQQTAILAALGEQQQELLSRIARPEAGSGSILSDLRRRQELPAFTGEEDPEEVVAFLVKLQDFLALYEGAPSGQVLGLLRSKLSGIALAWFRQWTTTVSAPSVLAIVGAVRARFLAPDAIRRIRDRIARLSQGSAEPTRRYLDRFNKLACAIPDEPGREVFLRDALIRSLRPRVRAEIKRAELLLDFDMEQLQAHLLELDEIDNESKAGVSPFSLSATLSASHAANTGVAPMEGVQFGQMQSDRRAHATNRNRLRAVGACFQCEGVGQHAQGCRSRFQFGRRRNDDADRRAQQQQPDYARNRSSAAHLNELTPASIDYHALAAAIVGLAPNPDGKTLADSSANDQH